MRFDVFISYSSADQKIAEGICGYLESKGLRCFVAYRDIPPGKVWASEIAESLYDSAMMVTVFSKNFNVSEQVDREIELASDAHKPILTFRLSDDKMRGAKIYYLKNLNWIDAFPNPAEAFGTLYDNVCKHIGIETKKSDNNDEEAIATKPKASLGMKKSVALCTSILLSMFEFFAGLVNLFNDMSEYKQFALASGFLQLFIWLWIAKEMRVKGIMAKWLQYAIVANYSLVIISQMLESLYDTAVKITMPIGTVLSLAVFITFIRNYSGAIRKYAITMIVCIISTLCIVLTTALPIYLLGIQQVASVVVSTVTICTVFVAQFVSYIFFYKLLVETP